MEHHTIENTIGLTVLGVLLLVVTVVATWAITREGMRTDALANGAGHWVIVDGAAAFAWGPAPE